ncbi:MAG TPA: J domain-containing protein [Candidatus Limnocylindrales bacterium]|nr:J domain-containing protein [Candidatus Limnocylindrales bacterium]
MSTPDPYKVLQVEPDATRDVIEIAYKRLARKYHPDVSTEPNAVARMVQINQAWELLRDPVRRASVDRALGRSAATRARVVAADGKAQAAAGSRPARPTPGSGETRSWAFPGMQDPTTGTFGPGGERVSTNWTTGRSTEGYRYDSRTMGSGAAGPPPGHPSGSIVTFGRYQGWTIGEIARADLEYLEWLDRMPIGRTYQAEIDVFLRQHGRRGDAPGTERRGRGLFRRR